VKLDDRPPKYRAQVERKLADESRNTSNRSNVEQCNIVAPERNKKQPSPRRRLVLDSKEQVQRPCIQVPVEIVLTFFRKRLPDFDGCPTKWPIDALVEARILRDDAQKYVRQVHKEYQKVENQEDEYTIIEIYEFKETDPEKEANLSPQKELKL